MKNDVKSRQYTVFVMAILMIDIFIRPVSKAVLITAKTIIVTAIISALITMFFLYIFGKTQPLGTVVENDKSIAIFVCVIMYLSAGLSLYESVEFYAFTGNNRPPDFIVYILISLVIGYGVYMGLGTALRVSGVIFLFILVSTMFLIGANLVRFSTHNLQNTPLDIKMIGQNLLGLNFLPAEFIALFIICNDSKTSAKSGKNAILLVLALTIIITMAIELSMGSFISLQKQPVYTLARIGSISVFTRLDTIHVSFWVMAEVFKCFVFTACGDFAHRNFLKEKSQLKKMPISVIIVFFIGTIINIDIQNIIKMMIGIMTIVLLIWLLIKEKIADENH